MTPPLSMGDEVEIIGPSCDATGRKFAISQISGCEYFSCYGLPWYPASSLRLVEELKIGDWVEVIGPTEFGGDKWQGKIFEITCTHTESPAFGGRDLFSAMGVAWYPAKSLRKLAPEEIQQHTSKSNTLTVKFKCDTSEFEEQLDKAADKMWKVLVDERLSAITRDVSLMGKELETVTTENVPEIYDRLSAIEDRVEKSPIGCHNSVHEKLTKRLATIEEKQKDILSLVGAETKRVDNHSNRLSAIETRQDNHGKRLADVEYAASDMQKEIDVLKGEMPEVCDRQRDPAECIREWNAICQKVLDSMR